MQLLKVADCFQDAGQAESDYDSAGSESDRSDRDPDNQVIFCFILLSNLILRNGE